MKNPQVLIQVTTFGNLVSVLGAVGLPGSFTLDRPTTLVQALSRAGGMKEDSGAGAVVLRRRGPRGMVVTRYDAKAILNGEPGAANVFLQNNDEVYVEQGAVYFLYGYVNKPGLFPLAALSMCSRRSPRAAASGRLARIGASSCAAAPPMARSAISPPRSTTKCVPMTRSS